MKRIYTAVILIVLFSVYGGHIAYAGGGGGGGGGGGSQSQWIKLSGYAWNETIGLISLNCANDNSCGSVNYAVEIDIANKSLGSGTGKLRGLAWNPTFGWISFEGTDVAGCPRSGTCYSRVRWSQSSGNFEGWARVLPGNRQPPQITERPTNGGWISLNCADTGVCGSSNYKVSINSSTGLLSGFAWEDDFTSSGNEYIGWIDFSSATGNFVVGFSCFLNDAYGRKLIRWNETNTLGATASGDKDSQNAFSLDESVIAPGTYLATLVSYDGNHPDGELGEGWGLGLGSDDYSSISYFAPDLPDYTNYGEFDLASSFIIEDRIDFLPLSNTVMAFYNKTDDPTPFQNDINPACAMLTFTCPFEAAEGRTIVNLFDPENPRISGNQESSSKGPIQKISISPGTYMVSLASFDEHVGFPESDEVNESWYIELFSDTEGSVFYKKTDPVEDLPLDEDFFTETLSKELVLLESTHSLRAIHSGYPGANVNDVTPVCVALDRITTNPFQCNIPDQSGRKMIYFDGTEIEGGENTPAYSFDENLIPQGKYEATLASYDYHPDDETKEEWSLRITGNEGTFSVGKTNDLGNTVSYNEYSIGEITIPFSITSAPNISAVNFYGAGISGTGIHPACVALDPVPEPEAGAVSILPASQSKDIGENFSISWEINGVLGGNGCVFSSNPQDSGWNSNSNSTPQLSGIYAGVVGREGTQSYMLSCEFSDSSEDNETAFVFVPPQCSDGIDNDNDGFCDTEGASCEEGNTLGDRGCTEAIDDNESDDNICVPNDICETWYGETPLNCEEDCVISNFENI